MLQGGARLDLLHQDDVKEDLEKNGLALTANQQGQLNDLYQTLDRRRKEGFRTFFQLGLDERKQRWLDEARTKEDALDTILDPAQLGRINQIALQLKQGLSAFHDPEVVEDLKLTSAQKDSLRVIEAEAFIPRPDNRRGTGGPGKGPEPGLRPPTEKVLAVLTEDQKRRWRNMTGEPFQKSPPPPDHGPHGPRPNGPPGPSGFPG